MEFPTDVKAIIFDMDGVLVDSMPFHYRAWKTVLESLGVEAPKLDIYRREGEKGEVTARDYLVKAGQNITNERISNLLKEKETLFKQIGKPHLFEQTSLVLPQLKKRDYVLGLVTGTSYDEAIKVLPRDIMDLFSTVVTGDQLVRGKPYPDPYLKALHEINMNADKAVVIENAPYGIQSAISAGIYCIAITSYLGKKYLAEANQHITTLDELLYIFT